ncbi:hypothetical protein Tco_1459042 [Tanacetum coccineum]
MQVICFVEEFDYGYCAEATARGQLKSEGFQMDRYSMSIQKTLRMDKNGNACHMVGAKSVRMLRNTRRVCHWAVKFIGRGVSCKAEAVAVGTVERSAAGALPQQVPGYNHKAYEELVAVWRCMNTVRAASYRHSGSVTGLPHLCDNDRVVPLKSLLEAHAIRLEKEERCEGLRQSYVVWVLRTPPVRMGVPELAWRRCHLRIVRLLGKLWREAGDTAYNSDGHERKFQSSDCCTAEGGQLMSITPLVEWPWLTVIGVSSCCGERDWSIYLGNPSFLICRCAFAVHGRPVLSQDRKALATTESWSRSALLHEPGWISRSHIERARVYELDSIGVHHVDPVLLSPQIFHLRASRFLCVTLGTCPNGESIKALVFDLVLSRSNGSGSLTSLWGEDRYRFLVFQCEIPANTCPFTAVRRFYRDVMHTTARRSTFAIRPRHQIRYIFNSSPGRGSCVLAVGSVAIYADLSSRVESFFCFRSSKRIVSLLSTLIEWFGQGE